MPNFLSISIAVISHSWHASCRRNCVPIEYCVAVMLDGLLEAC